jgi:hypothetical protein
MPRRSLITAALALAPGVVAAPRNDRLVIERVTTVVPFPRGLAMVDGRMFVLARGRVRDAGGVSAAVNDRAGTIYVIDPDIGQPIDQPEVSEAVRTNGRIFAEPTEPPFKLWNRDSTPPEADRETDRPYCTLRWHAPTRSFYICGFSGIDLKQAEAPGSPSFSKNCSDVILRYDLRSGDSGAWHEVERHHLHAGGTYPHHDPAFFPPPHGWLNGPDNILPVGQSLYAAAKDNSLLVRYDLTALAADASAGYPPSEVIFNERIRIEGAGTKRLYGPSALAERDGWLYIGYRTTSQVIRLRLDEDGTPQRPIRAQLVATFDPYDPATGTSANITDITFDSRGWLYVLSANGGLVHRFLPNPRTVHDARGGRARPWLHLGERTGKPKIKCENLFIDSRDRLFITSGDGYAYQDGADGTVYRVSGIE